jgi:quercetin dioxygenase-like cupin family protein
LNETELVCSELTPAIERLVAAGFRLDVIYPADDPHTAILTGPDGAVRLTSRPDAPRPAVELPPLVPEFVISRGGDADEGRAGMLYRDLIPGRLGGRYIASLITIPEGGPVADWVHFHRIALQLICVRSGWVRVVYEDQGEPFVMHAGDVVLQAPGIRHRVLESSPGLEVVEITCPALHETFADHELALPTERVDPERLFGGQRFHRHVAAQTEWTPFAGGEAQQTAIGEATNGLAEVRIVRPANGRAIAFPPREGELVFGFVLEGSAILEFGGRHDLALPDAFVIPPGEAWSLCDASPDLRLLHVTTARIASGLAVRRGSPL